MRINHTTLIQGALFLASVFLTACGGGGGGGAAAPAPATYTIGGTVTGLSGTVVLQNNGGNSLTITANGSFTFTTALASGASYLVTVQSDPASQTCTASSNTGPVASANVTSVVVTCSVNTYSIGGTISGLTGTVVLQNNATDDLSRSANGIFTFTTEVAHGAGYAVTVLTQPAGQRCTVTSNGSSNNVVADVADVAVTCVPVYTVGGTVTGLGTTIKSIGLVLQNTGPVTGNDITPAIVAGGSNSDNFAFAIGLAENETYDVKVFIQPVVPALTCTVSGGGNGDGTGTMGTSDITDVAITCGPPVPRFAYVANYDSGDVSAYTIDPATGELTQIDADTGTGGIQNFQAGTGPVSVAVAPSGKFAFVINNGSSDISAYTIDTASGVPSSGALTQVPCTGSSVCNVNDYKVGDTPKSVAIDPSGRFVYVANLNSDDLSAFAIDPDIGALTQIDADTGTTGTQNFLAGDGPVFVTVDHSGQFVYVANANDNSISAYRIGTDGALTEISSPVDTGNGPRSIGIDPTSTFVYVANKNDDSVSAYTIDTVTTPGALIPIDADTGTGGIQNFQAGTEPNSVAVSPDGLHVYVSNTISNDISMYDIDSSGVLTPIGGSPVAMQGSGVVSPTAIAIDLLGAYAYVANADGGVAAFSIDPVTGALTQINCGGTASCNTGFPGGWDFLTGTQPLSVVTAITY